MGSTISVRASDTALPLVLTINQEGIGGITGKSPTVAIRQISTGYYLDWADDTFKVSGWTTKYAVLSELERGHYQRLLDITAISSSANSVLAAEFYVDDGAGVSGVDHDLLIITDDTDNISLLRKHTTNRLEHASGDPGSLTLYDDDDTTPIRTWSLTDENGDEVFPTVGAPAKRGKAT